MALFLSSASINSQTLRALRLFKPGFWRVPHISSPQPFSLYPLSLLPPIPNLSTPIFFSSQGPIARAVDLQMMPCPQNTIHPNYFGPTVRVLCVLTSSYIPARFSVLHVHPMTPDNYMSLIFGVFGVVLPPCSVAFPIGNLRRTFFWGVSFCSLVLCWPLLGPGSQSPSLGSTLEPFLLEY